MSWVSRFRSLRRIRATWDHYAALFELQSNCRKKSLLCEEKKCSSTTITQRLTPLPSPQPNWWNRLWNLAAKTVFSRYDPEWLLCHISPYTGGCVNIFISLVKCYRTDLVNMMRNSVKQYHTLLNHLMPHNLSTKFIATHKGLHKNKSLYSTITQSGVSSTLKWLWLPS